MSTAKWRESSGSISVKCRVCRKATRTFPSRANRKRFCSRACYAKWLAKERAGKRHPMYGRTHRPESIAKMRQVKAERARRGPLASGWKGGAYMSRGYRMVTLSDREAERFGVMAKDGRYVPEHRLVMARKLGRPLLATEVVHHRNGVKTDNRLRNLELSDNATHKRDHAAILRELRRLRRENEALRFELRKCRAAG